MFDASKTQKVHTFGISEDEKSYCVVSFSPFETKPQTFRLAKPLDLNAWLALETEKIKAVKKGQKIVAVRPLPHSYLWRKYLVLPRQPHPDHYYRQLIQLFEQQLPLPLQDIYFDYLVEPLPDSPHLVRMIAVAIKQPFADQLMLHSQTILDCELHCIKRAIRYLTQSPCDNFIYQAKSFKFEATALHINRLTTPQSEIEDLLYLTALGAALWHLDNDLNLNLTPSRFQQWKNNFIKKAKNFAFILLCSLTLGIGITFQTMQLFNQSQAQQQSILHLEKQLAQFEQKILQLQTQNQTAIKFYLNKTTLIRWLNLFQSIPIKSGGIDNLYFFIDESANQAKWQLTGTYKNSQEFSILEQYLSDQKITFKVEHFKSNEQQKIHFILSGAFSQEE